MKRLVLCLAFTWLVASALALAAGTGAAGPQRQLTARPRAMRASTVLRVDRMIGAVDTHNWGASLWVFGPGIFNFQWTTMAKGAVAARWVVTVRPCGAFQACPDVPLGQPGSQVVGSQPLPGTPGASGSFQINFAAIMPSPPKSPAVWLYYVYVVLSNARGQDLSVSAPVTITYSAEGSQTQFDEDMGMPAPAPKKKPADIKVFTWSFPQAPVTMLPVNAGLCALTGMSGNFRGGGERVWVTQSNGQWLLGGESQTGSALAQAHCLKYADLGAPYDDIRTGVTSAWLGCGTAFCRDSTVIGDYPGSCQAAYLNGVSGDFERPSRWRAPSVAAGTVSWKSGDYTYNGVGVLASGRGFRDEDQGDVFASMTGVVNCLSGHGIPWMGTGRTWCLRAA